MLRTIKPCRRFVLFYNFLSSNRQNFLISARPFTCHCKIRLCNTPLKLNITNRDLYKSVISREKSNSKNKRHKRKDEQDESDEEDDDDDDDDDNEYNFKGDEMKTYETEAKRVDKILKICFNISRTDLEDMFYQTKVRVNGKILKKKSANVNIGDEIDIIKGFVNDNSKLLSVNRVEILNIKGDPDCLKYSIKVKKSKSLTVHNYIGGDEWRG